MKITMIHRYKNPFKWICQTLKMILPFIELIKEKGNEMAYIFENNK